MCVFLNSVVESLEIVEDFQNFYASAACQNGEKHNSSSSTLHVNVACWILRDSR